MHVLVVGQQRVGLAPVAVDVPDPQHGQQHRQVLLQRGRAEVGILWDKGQLQLQEQLASLPTLQLVLVLS